MADTITVMGISWRSETGSYGACGSEFGFGSEGTSQLGEADWTIEAFASAGQLGAAADEADHHRGDSRTDTRPFAHDR